MNLVDIMIEHNLRNDTHYEFGTDKEFNHKYCTAFYDEEFRKYRYKENLRMTGNQVAELAGCSFDTVRRRMNGDNTKIKEFLKAKELKL